MCTRSCTAYSPAVVPFSVVPKIKLQPICHMSAFLAEGVPNFEIRDAAGMTDLLIRDNKPRSRAGGDSG